MNAIKWFVLAVFVSGLAGCDGSSTSGIEFIECESGSVQGQYSGTAVSQSGSRLGVIRLNLFQRGEQKCDLEGAVSLEPCLQGVMILGRVIFDNGFLVGTGPTNPSLDVKANRFDFTDIGLVSRIAVGQTISGTYRLTSQSVPGCPASDLGTVELTRTG